MHREAADPSSYASGLGACFRLPLDLELVGASNHRSGWPFVMEHLRAFHHSKGILLDDFVERTIRTEAVAEGWREPWVGIFHHPPNLPSWLDPGAPLDHIMSTAAFRASLPNLKGAIALSQYLGNRLRNLLPCPVLVLKHPTETPKLLFSFDHWEQQDKRRIVQVGWYARNHRAIYQLDVPETYRKIHLLNPEIQNLIERTDQFSPYRERAPQGEVEIFRRLGHSDYDELMASSLVFSEYWDVSASNVVVEAIARNTPLVVNRHPALEEYLGAEYPLFFDDFHDIRELLSDSMRISHAWRYIREMNKTWLSASSFAENVANFVNQVSGL
jgi:hypothetical protein